MVPTVAPNISLIPPVVQNSSLYDGMQQSSDAGRFSMLTRFVQTSSISIWT